MHHHFFISSLCFIMAICPLSAYAATATFESDAQVLTNGDIQLLGATDASSFFVGSGDTLFIQLDMPIGTDRNNDLFTLNYANGNRGLRTFGINFGFFDGTTYSPILQTPQNFTTRGTGAISLFGFSRSCSVAGGCNFISITGGARGGGYSIDSVAVNGEIITPNGNVPAAPEPGTWALMLLGFAGMAFRLKHIKQQERIAMTYKHSLV